MAFSRSWMLCGLTLIACGSLLLYQEGCRPNAPRVANAAEPAEGGGAPKVDAAAAAREVAEKNALVKAGGWKSLFDGKTLTGWKAPDFGGQGKVYVKDGAIVLEMGSSMTGVTWTGPLIRDNYELELEGIRHDGSDFFCTTTFPVGDDSCSFVVGGWGGMLVGLSNVDFEDASNNLTMKTIAFKENQWYKVRIRVSEGAIETWIDDQQVVNQPRDGHKFSVRFEVDLCRPLGVSTWCTKGAVRNIRIRPLKPEEIQAAREKAKAAAAAE